MTSGITYVDQLLIRYSAFKAYWRKNGSNTSATVFKKAYDSVRREVLYNSLTEVCIQMKLG